MEPEVVSTPPTASSTGKSTNSGMEMISNAGIVTTCHQTVMSVTVTKNIFEKNMVIIMNQHQQPKNTAEKLKTYKTDDYAINYHAYLMT